METQTAPQQSTSITAEGSGPSLGEGHATVREHGLRGGVRVLDNGRLDIKFGEERRWITQLMKQMEPSSKPGVETKKPSIPSPTEEEKWVKFPIRLNIVVQVVGSRGDIQPFIALGKELQKHGHRVRLATHLEFRDPINEAGLEFFNIGGDPEQLMAFMVQNPGLIPGMRTIRSGGIGKRRREMKTIFSGCWRSCYETGDGTQLHENPESPGTAAVDKCMQPFVADVIIANPPTFVHLSCAERLGIPLNMMFTMPWSPTQAFPHPLATIRSQSTKPSAANFASYGVVEVMMWEGLGDLINHFRKKQLGLDPLDAIRAPSINHRLQVPYTYLWSPSLLPKPQDWPDHLDVCGFQVLPAESDYSPPEDLDAFLKAGKPPVYIGFGSIVVEDPGKLTKILIDAVTQTGQRALISKGWSNLGSEEEKIPDSIFLLGKCPHDWLFKHVSCVVHHGGAGTTAAGLLLGRPTVIVPFFGDQPFWGFIVEKAGAGPPPVPFKQLTAEKLADAIKIALEPSTRECAEEIGAKMKLEKGPAVWWLKRSHVKLSALAFSILMNTGHIQPGDVELFRAREYDTNRDPKGPLTAAAGVLYGVTTDLFTGIARIPGHIADMFPGSEPNSTLSEYRMREWAIEHFAEVMSNQQQENGHQPVSETGAYLQNGDNRAVQEHREASQSTPQATAQTTPHARTNDEVNDRQDIPGTRVNDINKEFSTRQKATHYHTPMRSRARKRLLDARDGTERLAKRTLAVALVIPTDLTLSVSKGFHNLPKLYHDTTVQNIPTVRGFKTGLWAAEKEFVGGFYDGFTGLITQPAHGFQETGGKGLAKGVGKGIGGVFFKPAAGICGLVGFPLDGIHKNLRKSLAASKSKEILRSRITQGIQEMCAASPEEQTAVIRKWHALHENGA
ncbi:hypothetical protein EYZ11_007367 [Aspergillus tanneri]|uniref:Uncharacterized protein n=1 Tax=Aspergillus tanneri TaxID=1220188 RepID=A0A4S3JFG1_9EURO|nr:hypothetical protein EYZ11_007367 [Aspergillus tanneri]